ncbi:MAG: hypothetical protein ACFCUS_05190 [Rubrimonas sp.]
MTRLKQLETGGRLAVSLFCLTVLFALVSSILLVMYSTASSSLVDSQAVARKYAQNMLTGAMWGSMYEYVTEDESIHITQRWIDAGFPRDVYESEVKAVMAEDCTNCHSKTSTMTKAIPSMPLTTYEEVVSFSTQGLPDGKLLKGLHFHLFGIGTALLALGVLLAFTDLAGLWKAAIPLAGFAGLWLDTGGWIAGRVTESAAWMIIGGGALMNGALGAMAALVLLDCWLRVPLLSGPPKGAYRY